MRNKIISILLFLLFFILYSRFFIPSSVHASTTTLYFGPIEKTYDDSGRVVEEKVYYPAGSVTAVKTVNSEQETVNTNYLHSDHLGSTVLVTGENGDKKEENIYYPYGRQLTVNSEQSIDKLYTGQRLDSSSDLYFYNARYYNPAIGHFISADPVPDGTGLSGPNRYAYVGNNPVMRNDPSGNSPNYPSEFLSPADAISMMKLEKEKYIKNNPNASLSEVNDYMNNLASRELWLKNTNDDTKFFPKYVYSDKGGVLDLEHFFIGTQLSELQDQYIGKILPLPKILKSVRYEENAHSMAAAWEFYELIIATAQKTVLEHRGKLIDAMRPKLLKGQNQSCDVECEDKNLMTSSQINFKGAFSYEDINSAIKGANFWNEFDKNNDDIIDAFERYLQSNSYIDIKKYDSQEFQEFLDKNKMEKSIGWKKVLFK